MRNNSGTSRPADLQLGPFKIWRRVGMRFARTALVVTGASLTPLGQQLLCAQTYVQVAELDPNRVTSLRDVGRFQDSHPAVGVSITTIEEFARSLPHAGEAGRRIVLFGSERNVGTTMTAITLARALAKNAGRVVLIDLALGAPNLSVISSDPGAPGIADIVRGAATVSQIITRDRLSRVHLVAAGSGTDNISAILSSSRLSIAIEALARAYEYMIIDAGAVPAVGLDRFVRLAPKAVLVAADPDSAAARAAQQRLHEAGFADVTLLAGQPKGPETGRKAA